MDGFLSCQCGKVTCACSIHPNTRDEWIASMRGSLAKILASLETKPDLAKELAAGFTEKSCELLMSLDPDTCSWRMSRQSSLWEVLESELSSPTFPRWGFTLAGSLYAHPMSERRITATGGGALQPDGQTFHHTPNTGGMDGGSNSRKALAKRVREMFATPNTMDVLPSRSYEAMKRQATNGGRKGRMRPSNLREQIDPLMCQAYDEAREEANADVRQTMQMWPTPQARAQIDTPSERNRNTPCLETAVKMWPTPSASDNRDRGNLSTPAIKRRVEKGKQVMLSMCVSEENGRLNPRWVEWLMDFPIGFTIAKHFKKAGGKKSQASGELPQAAPIEPINSDV